MDYNLNKTPWQMQVSSDGSQGEPNLELLSKTLFYSSGEVGLNNSFSYRLERLQDFQSKKENYIQKNSDENK